MRFLMLAVASSFVWATACGDDNGDPGPVDEPGTIAAEVGANAQFSTLKTALEEAGLLDTFEGAGPFTVFAPTNAAFEALPAGALDALLADPDALSDVLQYHVVSGRVSSAEVIMMTEFTTLLGEQVTVEVVEGTVVLNGTASVTTADVAASNGVIHVIDAVLLPPEPAETNTILDAVKGDDRFSTLATAVAAAGLEGALSGAGPLTVFAPTNDAFEALDADLSALLADTAALTEILTYHVVSGDVDAATVTTLSRATAFNGIDFSITVDEEGVLINGTVRVTETDIRVDNGIIHVIDAVMTPPGSIVEIAIADGRFTTLVTAVTAAELAETLDEGGPFTVFAPTDAAFDLLPEGTVAGLLEEDSKEALIDLLQYHVATGKRYSDAVVAASSIEMLNGLEIDIRVDGDKVFIGDAEIILVDIIANNGVIHVIDAVLLPPVVETNTILDAVKGDERFSTLAAAVEAAGLEGALSAEGSLTVFAPTDAAFAALPAGTLEFLLEAENLDTLVDILTYHVVDGSVDAATVVTLPRGTALNGVDFAISVVEGEVFINGDVKVTETDITVDNGIIHVIDAVMTVPGDIVAIAVADGRFTTLATALGAADLIETLEGEGPFTVFAPTDTAFNALPAGVLDSLLLPENKDDLIEVLLYHVTGGKVYSEAVAELSEVEMFNGDFAPVTLDNGAVLIDGAEVIIVDIIARNGVIHVIDAVIVPPEPMAR